MANLTQIELPTGSVYDLMDQGARDLIAALNSFDYLISTNAATTPYGVQWDDDGTTITGTLVASADTMYTIYLVPSDDAATNDGFSEYITVNPSSGVYSWEKFGSVQLPDMSNYVSKAEAGDLAYKDTASGSGSVTVPATYTTTTTVATTSSESVSVSGTTAGSVSVTKGVVDVVPNASGTAANKYTPEGSIAVSSAGSTATINNPTAKTVVTDMSVSDPSATTATGELVYCSVSGTKLSLKKFVETTGDSITTSAQTVKTGDASYSFTGTDTYLKTASDVATDASFTGASMTATGSVSVPATFTSSTTTATTESKTVNVTVS